MIVWPLTPSSKNNIIVCKNVCHYDISILRLHFCNVIHVYYTVLKAIWFVTNFWQNPSSISHVIYLMCYSWTCTHSLDLSIWLPKLNLQQFPFSQLPLSIVTKISECIQFRNSNCLIKEATLWINVHDSPSFNPNTIYKNSTVFWAYFNHIVAWRNT